MRTLRDVFANVWVKFAGFIILVLFLLAFVYYMRNILVPFMLAFLIAYIVNPAIDFFSRFHIPRALGVALLAFLVLTAIFVIGFLIYVDIRSTLANAPVSPSGEKIEIFNPGWINDMIQKQIGKMPERLQPALRDFSDYVYKHLVPRIAKLLEYADEAIAGLFRSTVAIVFGIFNFLIFLIVSIYLLIDYHKFLDTCYGYIPVQYRTDASRIARQLDSDLRAFFLGQLSVAGTLSIVYLIGLIIAGIPYAVPVAIVSGLGNMVPYMGTAVGLILGFTASILYYGFDIHMLYIVIVFISAQVLDGMLVSPLLIGKNTGFNPVIVILALLIFGKLLGFLGVLLAIPLTSVCRVLLRELYNNIEIKGKVEQTASQIISPEPMNIERDENEKKPG